MLPPPAPPDLTELLAASARVRECGASARTHAGTLAWRMDDTGLSGPAGDALAALGAAVAGQLVALGQHCAVAADALLRAAHERAGR